MKVQIFALAFLALASVVYSLSECPEVDGEWAVTIGNPANCSTFFICNAGEQILTDCPPDLKYNAELGVCDWPADANCVEKSAK